MKFSRFAPQLFQLLVWTTFMVAGPLAAFSLADESKPNVLLIVCDDLNDYVETLGGHPQAVTPNIRRLVESGVSFSQAHCNIPICNPSRSSFLFGIYPHTSQMFGFGHWDENEVLKNSRSMMSHFRAHGYDTMGTGKVMHNRDRKEWRQYGHFVDYGPFASANGKENVAHPDVPAPFRDDFGAIDGSFGPLRKLKPDEPFVWRTGNWKNQGLLRYESDDDRDPTHDELNTQWAVEKLKSIANKRNPKPFFMGVGFVRPHTPLIVPKKYFDRFPLEEIELPEILEGDVDDTFKHTTTPEGVEDRGSKIYQSLVDSFDGNRKLGLKKFIQAYLASVASVDDLVGQILDALDQSPLKDKTIVIFTSDHGWGMGEKDYLYKNSLWQESTRVPLVIRAPGVSEPGTSSDHPVSLIDLYPTLLDLCRLPDDTVKNDKGHPLEGFSLKPLLEGEKSWDGPDSALTAMSKWAEYYDPAFQSYSLRSFDWRYIRYENGKEELYHAKEDPNEWSNLAGDPDYEDQLIRYRKELLDRIPDSIPQPELTAEDWKDQYFSKHPEADANGDGKLTWPEFQAHKKKAEAAPKKNPDPGRLQTSGTFFRNERGENVFIDKNEGTSYYVIDSLLTKVDPYLDKEVKVLARVKPTDSGAAMLMVHIISINGK